MLPPKESLSNLVNLESLYGTKAPFFEVSERMFIQLPNASKDLLMFAPSYSLIPLFSVIAALSDPAKSTKHSLLVMIVYLLFVFWYSICVKSFLTLFVIVCSMWKVKIAWDLELNSFYLVDAIYLLVFPKRIQSKTCSSETICFSINSGTKTPLEGSSTTIKLSLLSSSESKSRIYSLYISK